MKKIIILLILLSSILGCGGIKGLVSYEPFTHDEILLFKEAFELYSAEDNNGEINTSKEESQTILSISGNYPTPNNNDEFLYQYTKEKGLFVFRSYKNGELFEKIVQKDFRELLKISLRINL